MKFNGKAFKSLLNRIFNRPDVQLVCCFAVMLVIGIGMCVFDLTDNPETGIEPEMMVETVTTTTPSVTCTTSVEDGTTTSISTTSRSTTSKPKTTTSTNTTTESTANTTTVIVTHTSPVTEATQPPTTTTQTPATEPPTEAPTQAPNNTTSTTRPVIYDCTLSDDVQQHIYNTCNSYGVPYELIMAIIKKESTFNPNASNGSCVGLMQLHKGYNSDFAATLGVYNLYDPYGNTTVGIAKIADLLSRYSMTDALICYNCGEYGARPYLGGSTSYSRTVMSYYYAYLG